MANLFESPRYIAVEGPIRVGKSTLARILGERLNAQRVIEPEDNPFLRALARTETPPWLRLVAANATVCVYRIEPKS